MSVSTIAWLTWVAAFVVIETWALIADIRNGTLSAHFRQWFHTDTKRGRTAFVVVSLVFMGWFIPHIMFGGTS